MYDKYNFQQDEDRIVVTPKVWDPIGICHKGSIFTITGLTIISLRMGTTKRIYDLKDYGDAYIYGNYLCPISRPDLQEDIIIPDEKLKQIMGIVEEAEEIINGDIRQYTRHDPVLIEQFLKENNLRGDKYE